MNYVRFLLTLYRQGLYRIDESNQAEKQSGKSFFVMDYFDKLIVKQLAKDESLVKFWGMDNDVTDMHQVTAVQNYAIYKEYQENEKQKDIFSNNLNNEFPFLGLILVYVNPDIIVNLSDDVKDNCMQGFESDLQLVIDYYRDTPLHAEVFRMASAGDFLIAVRGKRPEDIFSVSTSVRKRIVQQEEDELNKNEGLTCYKTYTILTIGGNCVNYESADKINTINQERFLLRGRYSNKYWNDRNGNNSKLSTPAGLKSLNGRYDFMLSISADEFQQLLPIFESTKKIYLNTENDLSDVSLNESGSMSENVQYLLTLLQNQWLSYMNERCMIQMDVDTFEDVRVKSVRLNKLRQTTTFLFNCIIDKCDVLEKKLEETIRKSKGKDMDTKLANISLKLLRNLIGLCRSVNGLSDIRIHTIAFLEQIEVVISSIERWVVGFQGNDFGELNFYEEELRDAVIALELYSGVIRNENVQTIQSPHYNVVPGCSIEKILICYSRFFEVIMSSCSKYISEQNNSEVQKIYFPVVVPDLKRDSLGVNILFPEGYMDSAQSNADEKYLMVVWGPATGELLKLENMIPIMFHEMGHNLRYESRTERNRIIADILLADFVDNFTCCFFRYVIAEKRILDETGNIKNVFFASIMNVMKKHLKSALSKGEEMCLEKFVFFYQNEMNNLILSLQEEELLRRYIKDFFDATNEYIGQIQIEIVEKVYKSLAKMNEKSCIDATEIQTIKEELKTNLTDYVKSICDQMLEKEEIEAVKRMEESLLVLIHEYHILEKEANDKAEILDEIYKTLYDNYRGVIENNKDKGYYGASEKQVLEMLRKLGLDYDTEYNRSCLKELLSRTFSLADTYHMDEGKKLVSLYREETADIFMLNICEMNLKEYLVLCSNMFISQAGHYSEGFVDRFCDNILVQWCIEDGKQDIPDQVSFKSEVLSNVMRAFSEILMEYELTDEQNNVLTQLSGEDALQKCILLFKAARDNINPLEVEDRAERQIAYRKAQIANLAMQILRRIKYRISHFVSQPDLLRDYLHGKTVYGAVRKRLEDSSFCDNWKERNIIVEMCGSCNQYLGCLDIKEWKQVSEDFYRDSLNFIMDMYYSDKLSRRMEGDNYGNKDN